MLVPVGAGPHCFGYILLAHSEAAPWPVEEIQAALEIDREVGRALLRAQVYDELKQLDRDKTEMFATVAHELKNPLTAISGHLELLEVVGSLRHESARASLTAIDRAAARMGGLVDDLLVLARVADPHRSLPSTDVDLAQVVRGAADLPATTAHVPAATAVI
jgi:signal transduction histidine kinase